MHLELFYPTPVHTDILLLVPNRRSAVTNVSRRSTTATFYHSLLQPKYRLTNKQPRLTFHDLIVFIGSPMRTPSHMERPDAGTRGWT